METAQVKFGVELSGCWGLPECGLRYAALAEKAGFDSIWVGDHFLPSVTTGTSPFSWVWITSALERTHKIRVGPDVTVPIGARYHPAIVAQAFATLDNIYPGRVLLGVGTGEALNEERFAPWPRWSERMGRLVDGLELIRKLWTSEDYFDYNGQYFQMKNTFLYCKPKGEIPVYFSALGKKAAYCAGKSNSSLMTAVSLEDFRDDILPSFLSGAKSVGKDVSETERLAAIGCTIGDIEKLLKEYKDSGSTAEVSSSAFDERDPKGVEEINSADLDAIRRTGHDGSQYFCESLEDFIKVIEEFIRVGATYIMLGVEGNNAEETLESYRERIISYFRE